MAPAWSEPTDPREIAIRQIESLYLAATPETFAEHLSSYGGHLAGAFLTLGVTPDAREKAPPRRTVLMLALLNGSFEAAGRLLDAGADPALVDDHGLTAMCWAALGAGLRSWSPEVVSICERIAALPGVREADRSLAAAMGNGYGAFALLLRRWCELRRPERAARMRPGATPERLVAVAARAGRELPAAFTALYRAFDGEAPTGLLTWRLLPLDEVAATSERMRKRPVHNDNARTFRWPDAWIPFATDITGDLLFVAPKLLGDKRPGGLKAPTEPVYLYFHDEDRIVREAWSFAYGLPRAFERLPRPGYPMG